MNDDWTDHDLYSMGFLSHALQIVYETHGATDVLYPFIEANTDMLVYLPRVIPAFVRDFILPQLEVQQIGTFASSLAIFATCMTDCPVGNSFLNLDIAIACYQGAQQVFSFDEDANMWLITQLHLGEAYSLRANGGGDENTDHAIACFESALEIVDPASDFEKWVFIKTNLATNYDERKNGQRIANILKAIEHNLAIIDVCRDKNYSEHRVRAQYNLGNAYLSAYADDEDINKGPEYLEKAVQCFEHVLEVITPDFPQWGNAQLKLGYAYQERGSESHKENIEKAISCYHKCLATRGRDGSSEDWANTQHNLGNAYMDRIEGNAGDNLEQAVEHFQNALTVRTCEAFPVAWAESMTRLAEAYRKRLKGDMVENLETAIECCVEVLRVQTIETSPQHWAGICHTLAMIYSERIKGVMGENLEIAINYLEKALQVFTYNTKPRAWARVYGDMLAIYAMRMQSDEKRNIEKAVQCFENAVRVFTPSSAPEYWCRLQYNLGLVYWNQSSESITPEEFERALDCFRNSLKFITITDSPQSWAKSHNALGNLYSFKVSRGETVLLEEAVKHYQEAVKVFEGDSYVRLHAEILYNLGVVYRRAGRLREAQLVFESAFCIIDTLREEIDSGGLSKQKFGEKYFNLSWQMVVTCLEMGDSDPSYNSLALEYVEKSKARNLFDLLLSHRSGGGNDDSISSDVIKLRNRIKALEKKLEIWDYRFNTAQLLGRRDWEKIKESELRNMQNCRTEYKQLKKQLSEMTQECALQTGKLTDEPWGRTMNFAEIKQLLTNSHTTLVEWHFNREMLVAFVVTPGCSAPLVWQASVETKDTLKYWWLQNCNTWQESIGVSMEQMAAILHIDKIVSWVPADCTQIILIPSFFLRWLPLHILPLSDGRILLDRFPKGVRYAPSCRLARAGQQKLSGRLDKLFAVENPTGDLSFACLEVEGIKDFFSAANSLEQGNATKEAVLVSKEFGDANCLHFSCHGSFEYRSPLESFLSLASGDRVLLADIMDLSLGPCRLVTLSACETGMSDVNLIDDYNSLSSAFLIAGSPSVVSSLWKVDDFSTSILMIRFYENLKRYTILGEGDVAVALNEAQQWLRDVTWSELLVEMEKPHCRRALERVKQKLSPGSYFYIDHALRVIHEETLAAKEAHSKCKPFADKPYYWAAFVAVGV